MAGYHPEPLVRVRVRAGLARYLPSPLTRAVTRCLTVRVRVRVRDRDRDRDRVRARARARDRDRVRVRVNDAGLPGAALADGS